MKMCVGGYECFFFFKQKTAYEMRIRDWSSDVCSTDLQDPQGLTWEQVQVDPRAASAGALRFDTRKTVRQRQAGLRLEQPLPLGALAFGAHVGSRKTWQMLSIRSEEHTSELQSLMRTSYAVSCLKKKNHAKTETLHNNT